MGDEPQTPAQKNQGLPITLSQGGTNPYSVLRERGYLVQMGGICRLVPRFAPPKFFSVVLSVRERVGSNAIVA